MSVSGFIILAVIAVTLGYGVTLYNSLVGLKHSVSKAWSNIDVLLKQRHDELPKLWRLVSNTWRIHTISAILRFKK